MTFRCILSHLWCTSLYACTSAKFIIQFFATGKTFAFAVPLTSSQFRFSAEERHFRNICVSNIESALRERDRDGRMEEKEIFWAGCNYDRKLIAAAINLAVKYICWPFFRTNDCGGERRRKSFFFQQVAQKKEAEAEFIKKTALFLGVVPLTVSPLFLYPATQNRIFG